MTNEKEKGSTRPWEVYGLRLLATVLVGSVLWFYIIPLTTDSRESKPKASLAKANKDTAAEVTEFFSEPCAATSEVCAICDESKELKK